MFGRKWVFLGAVLSPVFLLLAPPASAISPSFTVNPSYAAYGAKSNTGHVATYNVSLGSNRISVAPKFNVTTGIDKQSQRSWAHSGGIWGLLVLSGMENFNFTCPKKCTPGYHPVAVQWNLSYSVHLNTSCTRQISNPITFSSVNISFETVVWNASTPNLTYAALLYTYTFYHQMTGKGNYTTSKKGLLVNLNFYAYLWPSYKYQIDSVVIVKTFANSAAGGGQLCSAGASASIGTNAKTTLASVGVG